MGQHRTRQQKEHAQLARQIATSKEYSLDSLRLHKTLTLHQKIQQEVQKTEHTYIVQDLRKTLAVSLVIVILLGLTWWRLGSYQP